MAIKQFVTIIILLTGMLAPLFFEAAGATGSGLAGRILLQVEDSGEAWYYNPETLTRFYLGRPDDAWRIMRGQGLGVSHRNLDKIPIGLSVSSGSDADKDGLSDDLEKSLNTALNSPDTDQDGFGDFMEAGSAYNPLGPGVMPIDLDLTASLAGRILLQVEGRGEAWYLNPGDNKRYYLGRPADAFAVMRILGLGIKNSGLSSIPVDARSASLPEAPPQTAGGQTERTVPESGLDLEQLEFLLTELVNQKRLNYGLPPVSWNRELAAVARRHSQNLAGENQAFTGYDRSCDYPLIHHEGPEFGPYNSDRLRAGGIHYYETTGENIALVSAGSFTVRFRSDDGGARSELAACAGERQALDDSFLDRLDKAEAYESKLDIIERELAARTERYNELAQVDPAEIEWFSGLAVAREMADGWMDSPGHRENILTADYDEAGIGAVYANGYVIATQIFIKRAACGYLDGPCCKKSGYYPYCYIPLSCENSICAAGD